MNQIREWLDLPVIEIEQSQCLNYKSPTIICEKCAIACPTTALSITNNGVALKDKACIDCTACVATCPTLSIDYMPKQYSKTINEISEYSNADITCNQFDKYQRGIKIPCYRNIDEAMLIHYLAVKQRQTDSNDANIELQLYMGNCPKCKYKDVFSIKDHIQKLKDWCSQTGINLNIKEIIDPQHYLSKQGDVVVAGITRRSLLRSFGLARFKEPEQEKKIEADDLTYKQKNNYKRLLLNKSLDIFRDNLNIGNQEQLLPINNFAQVIKTEACRKCNICMRICPTDALEWVDGQDTAELFFYPRKCIACGRCEVCPESSIKIAPITGEIYNNQDKLSLATIKIKHCIDCKDVFIANEEASEQYCQLCKIKEEKKRALFDSL